MFIVKAAYGRHVSDCATVRLKIANLTAVLR